MAVFLQSTVNIFMLRIHICRFVCLQLEITDIVIQKLIKDDKFFLCFSEWIKDLYDSLICKHLHLIDNLPNQMNYVDENDTINKCPLSNATCKINVFNYCLMNLLELQELIVKIENQIEKNMTIYLHNVHNLFVIFVNVNIKEYFIVLIYCLIL
ncbi:hypothetical protein RFI_04645 [Reticulomyxa filosa]|uniref:Uncharacterized protein n=1 Tax=Reticulomyxa filosa TaxID=46433 RepID=X6P4E7_RETFI|nr:hypothetical protein RFI_04645 [Reticulomyxa filosa]|eukprot:ETO32472.1 hypothetical protein RFI_04645 [Reticulomyxa filosa]